MDVVLGIDKTADPTSLPPGAGQVSTFTLVVSTLDYPVDAVDVFDTLPPDWDYVMGNTTITLPDSTVISGPAADPIVSLPDLTWDLNQDMGANETMTIVFDGVTTAATASGYNQNDSQAIGTRLGGAQVFSPIDSAFVYISALTIDKDTSTPTVEPGGVATYTISIVNGTTGTITNVTVADDLPPDHSIREIVEPAEFDTLQTNGASDRIRPGFEQMSNPPQVAFTKGLNGARQNNIGFEAQTQPLKYDR